MSNAPAESKSERCVEFSTNPLHAASNYWLDSSRLYCGTSTGTIEIFTILPDRLVRVVTFGEKEDKAAVSAICVARMFSHDSIELIVGSEDG